MEILDIRKMYKKYYQPKPGRVEILEIPRMNFLMIDGTGNPNTSREYADSVSALYSIAYSQKFKINKSKGIDYNLLPLEGLWWMDDMELFSTDKKDEWKWTMMIQQPDLITGDEINSTILELEKKKPNPVYSRIRFEPFAEGLSAQIMHIGPYSAEKPTIDLLHRSITDQGYTLRAKHHEIYLGDPRKTAPEKLKTIIRQPVSQG